jgi:AcrR family transcriptional regulator
MLDRMNPMPIRVPQKPADAYQHGNLRAALIQAGLKLLNDVGVSGLSLRAAAQLAGVSHAAPYRHFADKEALVAAIGEQGFRLLTARMREEVAAAQPATAIERLRALGLGYVSFAVAHPAYLRVIFGSVASSMAKTPDLQAAGDEAYHVLREAVAAGIASGELRAGDVDVLALSCWSSVHGLSMLMVERALPSELCEAVAARATTTSVLDLLFDGLAAPKGAARPRSSNARGPARR